jgi:hypothetical protein
MRAMTSGENQDDGAAMLNSLAAANLLRMKQDAAERRGKRRAWWLASGLLTLVLLLGLGSWAAYTSDYTNPKRGAKIACQKFITDRLKAPTTAVFGAAKVEERKAAYVVTGSVDAENSFSAMVRDDYSCTVDWTREDGWRLRNLSIG